MQEIENSSITSPINTKKPLDVKVEASSAIDIKTSNSNSFRSFQSKCSNFKVFKMTRHSLNRREIPENVPQNNFTAEIKADSEEKAKIFSNFQNAKDGSLNVEPSLNFGLLQNLINIPFNSNKMTMILLQNICRIYQQILRNKEHIRISETLLR